MVSLIAIQIWPLALLGTIGLATLLFFLFRRTQAQRRKQIAERIRREGYFMEGTLLSCVPYADTRGSGFSVAVAYEFHSPDGVMLQGHVQENKTELSGTQLPAPGTPVYVLYFSDTEFYLL